MPLRFLRRAAPAIVIGAGSNPHNLYAVNIVTFAPNVRRNKARIHGRGSKDNPRRANAHAGDLRQRCSQFAGTTKRKACSNPRRRPSWLLTAYIPGLRFRRSRFFPYRRSTRPRLPSSEPSRPHIPCRHTSYGRQRWFPYRARSRYRPRTAR